jgi:hypothetical protein
MPNSKKINTEHSLGLGSAWVFSLSLSPPPLTRNPTLERKANDTFYSCVLFRSFQNILPQYSFRFVMFYKEKTKIKFEKKI